METQKIVNLLNDIDNESSRFAAKNGMSLLIKITENMIKEIKMKIRIKNDENTNVAFKNCSPFTRCVTHINNEHIDTAENLGIIMPMYNLIEYSDNYSDTSGSSWQFKRGESYMNDKKILSMLL